MRLIGGCSWLKIVFGSGFGNGSFEQRVSYFVVVFGLRFIIAR